MLPQNMQACYLIPRREDLVLNYQELKLIICYIRTLFIYQIHRFIIIIRTFIWCSALHVIQLLLLNTSTLFQDDQDFHYFLYSDDYILFL